MSESVEVTLETVNYTHCLECDSYEMLGFHPKSSRDTPQCEECESDNVVFAHGNPCPEEDPELCTSDDCMRLHGDQFHLRDLED